MNGRLRFPLHIHISTLFLMLILIVGGIIGGLGYTISRGILESSAGELSDRIGREAAREFAGILSPAEMATRLMSLDGITQADSLEARLASLGFMREALNNAGEVSGFYVGYGNGDFFLMRRLWQESERETFAAPAGTAYVVQSIEHRRIPARSLYIFFDASLKELRRDERPEFAASYDPRSRDWYKAAMAAPGQIKTPPYLFFTTRKVGITIANRSPRGDAVVGADIRLETLGRSLARQKVTPGTIIVLANQDGATIAFEDPLKSVTWPDGPQGKPALARVDQLGIPAFAGLSGILGRLETGAARDLLQEADNDTWRISIRPIQLEGLRKPLFLVTAIPDSELMAAAHQLRQQSLLAMVLVILLSVPVTWVLARLISKPLRKLSGEVEAIRHFEFSQPIEVESPVLEVGDLAATMDGMKRTIRRFMEISMAVAAENNFDRLLPRLLTETLSAADAGAGLLFLRDEDRLILASALLANGESLPASSEPIDPARAGPLMQRALESRSACAGPLEPADIDALRLVPAVQGSAATHAIAVPLLNRQHILVGALLILRGGATDAAHLKFIEALSGSAAVSLETKELIRAQKRLFEGFIQLIAGAIDAKSPYTGGHCARVPELTKMLARAACDETSGPYGNFQLDDEAWEAVHVAAWLHDCGKVTTPEYVVDKATKLETLYDRIHEIRTRFEVLKRDAEIACLKAIAAGGSPQAAEAALAGTLRQLDDDYAFVATCNEGGEYMAPEKQARLRQIASRTWMRTLDDRIGLSHEERARKAVSQEIKLPATESLLADKPEHLFPRDPQDTMPADNPWGFRMPVPELLYNKGELYNLSVARGTLSEEERYKINEHIVQTFIMLSQLPFPKHLREVPEIAAGHHEKMDGTGYPRRLQREELSPLARMMAIADIFEALTAVDRPYKKGKTLSEAVKIMAVMKKEGHIDPALFELFLRSGIYRQYAERFLRPEQIDSVDIAAYLDSPPAPVAAG
jgi:HD-GYP domain-containing protein (c-di-GMP phosphodiesterase class II)